ncbi:transporter substrate-binding domain-containing protein [Salipaludibacillus agaradhaerens]|uniref:transporter substrate-binding domain-containing protein n=1 Tax=Salipaludibacillus agaradhaerens TaxID=76935 RepID=UPI0021508930|nr:transporter substrate-binding domain-containing protein [Salipaludibacillus agaradhaerens]MCR6105242.1 transporter substrate-binding domain-containing protein [Salipaludibacillus agaradhaerens]MCR6117286.1 transporter substrate-binding domain-containing protein [Salipaludibacillus agaradhaerens]UJW56495.1 transporter substrate-binding domain-containing protein [Bacillus sp. A116_S68]
MNHFFKNKKQSLLLGGLSMTLILSACGGGENNQNEQNEESTPTAWDEIQESGVITVATSGTLYPTSYHSDEDNDLTGFEVEIVREVADRLDLDVAFTEMGFDGMLTSINSGQVDLAVNDIDINERREEDFLFTDPYKFSYGAMIVRPDDHSGIESLEDLDGKRHGGAATTIYMQLAEEYGAEGVTYDNVTNDTYLRDIENGRLDVVMNDYYLQSLAIEALPDIDVVIHPDLFYYPNNQAMIMKKDSVELQENINSVLAEMMEDGTITELSEQFFGGQDVSQEPDIDFEVEQ